MRQRVNWAWLLAGCIGLGMASVAWADDDTSTRPSGNWFARLFHRQPVVAKVDSAPVAAKPDTSAADRVRAQMDLMRQQEVCDKLREIAFQKGDPELRRKADQLDQRAWDSYVQKVSRLPGGRNGATPDEKLLDSQLGLGTGAPNSSNPQASTRRPVAAQAALRRD